MLTHHGLSVNLSRIVGETKLKLNISNIVKILLYQWLKKYFDYPFKDNHSHLPYGATDGPSSRSLQFYLPIIHGLRFSACFYEVYIFYSMLTITDSNSSTFCSMHVLFLVFWQWYIGDQLYPFYCTIISQYWTHKIQMAIFQPNSGLIIKCYFL